jgi:hypothetical protein
MKWPSSRFFQALGVTSFTLGIYNAVAAAAHRRGNIQNVERIKTIGKEINDIHDNVEKIADSYSKGNHELKEKMISEINRKIENKINNSPNPLQDQVQAVNQSIIEYLKIEAEIKSIEFNSNFTTDPITRLQLTKQIQDLQKQAEGKIVQIHDTISSINSNLYVAKTQVQDILEQITRGGHNFMDSFYKFIENFNNWLASLDYAQNIAFINLSGIFVIMVTLISIIFIFYGNKILDYLNLEQRYPKIAKLILLRRKFQQYYLLWDIFLITIILIAMFLMNLTLFI